MKKVYQLLLPVLLFSANTNGQYKWSAGYQLAFGNSNKVETELTGLPYKVSPPITNQFFLNRQISNHIILEAAVGNSTFKSKYYTVMLQQSPTPTDDYFFQKTNVWNVTLSAKYKVLRKNRFSLLIPLGVNNLIFSEKQQYNIAGTRSEWQTTRKPTILIAQNIFTGIEANLNITNRLYLNFQTNIGLFLNSKPDMVAAGTNSQGSVSYGHRAGIGYSF